jgi:hypothetical protein
MSITEARRQWLKRYRAIRLELRAKHPKATRPWIHHMARTRARHGEAMTRLKHRFATGMIGACLLFSTVGLGAWADCVKPKAIYKVSRLSLTDVGISCTNGADPTGLKAGDTLIISCGK